MSHLFASACAGNANVAARRAGLCTGVPGTPRELGRGRPRQLAPPTPPPSPRAPRASGKQTPALVAHPLVPASRRPQPSSSKRVINPGGSAHITHPTLPGGGGGPAAAFAATVDLLLLGRGAEVTQTGGAVEGARQVAPAPTPRPAAAPLYLHTHTLVHAFVHSFVYLLVLHCCSSELSPFRMGRGWQPHGET